MNIFWKSEIVMGSNKGLVPIKIKETRYCFFSWCYYKSTEEVNGGNSMTSWMNKLKKQK